MRDFRKSASIERLLKIIQAGAKEPTRGAILWVGAGLSIPAGYPSLTGLARRLSKRKRAMPHCARNEPRLSPSGCMYFACATGICCNTFPFSVAELLRRTNFIIVP